MSALPWMMHLALVVVEFMGSRGQRAILVQFYDLTTLMCGQEGRTRGAMRTGSRREHIVTAVQRTANKLYVLWILSPKRENFSGKYKQIAFFYPELGRT